MQLDLSTLSPRAAYHWMISMIVPRPIAWVSSQHTNGVVNLAPFSFFNGVTSRPPTLMFVPVTKADGTPKDTLRNVEATGEFVVNLVNNDLAEKMNSTAAALPPDESEMVHFDIASAPSVDISPPRVAGAPVAFECKLAQIVRMGTAPGIANVVFGTILRAHVADSVLNEDGKIDPAKLDLIGRMGGDDYCRTSDQFSIHREGH